MNRRTKFILLGITIIMYLVISLNFNKIRLGLNMFNLYSENKKIENINDDSDHPKVILDNPLKSIVTDNAEDDLEDEELEVEETEVPVTNEPASPSSKPQTDSNKSYVSIVNDYNSKLENLQSEFEADLDNLMSQGLKDYSKGDISTVKLASKYLSLGAALEKSSDAKFKSIIKDMERELKENKHDPSIIKEINAYYTSYKNSKKSDLISSGMKGLNK